jgi:hypothetical protein
MNMDKNRQLEGVSDKYSNVLLEIYKEVDETGEMPEDAKSRILEAQENFEDMLKNLVNYIDEIEADISFYEKKLRVYRDAKSKLDKMKDAVRDIIFTEMQNHELQDIDLKPHTLKIMRSGRPKIIVEDIEDLKESNEKYVLLKPNLVAIQDDYKATGELPDGVVAEFSYYLRIK